MTAATLVHLVRHGRTALNAEGRFRGRRDPPLDEEGRRQAEALARWLAPSGPGTVCSSPLLRARQTAEPTARELGVEVAILDGLIDLDHGAWTGLTREEAAAHDPEAFAAFTASPLTAAVPGGESMAGLERRVFDALAEIGDRHPGTAVVAVSHEIPIRLIAARLSGSGDEGFWDLGVPTGSTTELDVTGGRPILRRAPRTPPA
ncbi:MAG: histidine phosphatase family protein [Actinobacteria bacterium]|nr:histidine phosphatase family protein [Actinomycetota bacterium]